MCIGSQLKAGVIAFVEALERKIEDSDGAGDALERNLERVVKLRRTIARIPFIHL